LTQLAQHAPHMGFDGYGSPNLQGAEAKAPSRISGDGLKAKSPYKRQDLERLQKPVASTSQLTPQRTLHPSHPLPSFLSITAGAGPSRQAGHRRSLWVQRRSVVIQHSSASWVCSLTQPRRWPGWFSER